MATGSVIELVGVKNSLYLLKGSGGLGHCV